MASRPTDDDTRESLPTELTPEPLLRAIFDNTTTAIFVKDAGGRYVAVNPTCAALWDCDASAIIGRTDADLLPAETAAVLRAHDELVMATGEPQQVEEVVEFQGLRKSFLSSKVPIFDADGNVRAVCGVATEITDHRALLDELTSSKALLTDHAKRREEFLTVLAHELRNPLAPIRTAAEILAAQQDETTDMTSRAASVILRQVGHMARLIDDLLVVSRLTEGRIELETRRCRLDDVIEQAMEMVRPALTDHGQRVEIHTPGDPVVLTADHERIVQIIGNLLERAALCSDGPGTIRLDVFADEENVTFTVADDGPGMDSAQLEGVFEPLDGPSGSRPSDGLTLGLGLLMARQLVELHGGTLRAHSDGLGQGSEFTVEIPKGGPASSSAPIDSQPASAQPRRVLVVDDNEDAADMLAMLLEARGDDVAVCHSGAQASAVAREHEPDLVLLDIGLPDMNGRDVATKLRDEHGPDLQLVAVTGYGRAEDERMSRQAGFDAHIVKPITLDMLLKVIG